MKLSERINLAGYHERLIKKLNKAYRIAEGNERVAVIRDMNQAGFLNYPETLLQELDSLPDESGY